MNLAGVSTGTIAQAACLLELAAIKPGNVHRLLDFADATWLDFAMSAGALAGSIDRHAPSSGLGALILDAVESTRLACATNTNLGIVLLVAPLAMVPRPEPLREGVARVLEASTIIDARLAYRAIRLANPGGLGRSAEGQDVAGEPTVPLVEAMRLASGRDLVARQYATGYADLFDHALPDLTDALDRGEPPEVAAASAYLRQVARVPDTLISRKRGTVEASLAADGARRVVESGWPSAPGSAEVMARLDAWLREPGAGRNPGASADLIVATLFAALRDGMIAWPPRIRPRMLDESG